MSNSEKPAHQEGHSLFKAATIINAASNLGGGKEIIIYLKDGE